MVKNYDDMLSRFHLIPERYGRTDGLTDRQTDGRTDRFAISILRVSVLTRGKNTSLHSHCTGGFCAGIGVIQFDIFIDELVFSKCSVVPVRVPCQH